MQKSIQSLMMENDGNGTARYIELIQKIKWVNVVFNLSTKKPEVTGESGISVVVTRTATIDQIAIVQRVSKYFVGSVISVMILEPSSNKSSFAINNKETDSNGMFEQI
jgi:proteasome assembly chaperone (PAC2) family protein